MSRIKNTEALSRTPARRDALAIIEAGLNAVDTAAAVRRTVHLESDVLRIGEHSWDLSKFRDVHVIGFGKASCDAAAALDEILGERVSRGLALGTEARVCRTINVCEATHPLPSEQNLALSERIVKECESVAPEDLVIVVVSGGGSAMLCWPASECEQGVRLYHAANRSGITIHELNTVRKHLSALKGGGLAQLLHPATVIGLIFSDVPGDTPELVASGPTYPDSSTTDDARGIISKYRLGSYELTETPKDLQLFQNVTNVVVISNDVPLHAMAQRASELGYAVTMAGSARYDAPDHLVASMLTAAKPGSVILTGGESQLTLPEPHGTGGRNQHCALVAAGMLSDSQVFAAVATDGMDNGPHGGAIVDAAAIARARAAGIDAEDALMRFNEGPLLETTGDLLDIGPTGANVSDLYLLLTPKENPAS